MVTPARPDSGESAQFRHAHQVHLDNPTLMTLSLQIGRVEKEWMDRAGGRSRGRNRR